ncbi:3-phosphoshikimate 1-carboxyvinyltransferase [Micavibrio aeruginosavorus]|nr:3-phosphoshikimate 1-carboxyvinyltransferase [Micavibrio aeruginosavorus]
MHQPQHKPMTSRQCPPLMGRVRIPGDKSISHRALMLGALAHGETIISGLLEGGDVLATAAALSAMGAHISSGDDGLWRVHGVGTKGLHSPDHVLDMGNSGTSTRLLAGIMAGHAITATMTGDASLTKRPMGRVITPLEQMGAVFLARDGGKLPLTMRGSDALKPIKYTLPVASAQVKSAVLLAGLRANGTTTVIEEHPTRDHTENMLRHFGVPVRIEKISGLVDAIHVDGGHVLQGCAIDVPGDPSSAAFLAVAALIVPGSDITLPRIGINPRRIGLYDTLKEMGADIEFKNIRTEAGEPIADIAVRYTGTLQGITVPPERVPSMIDEIPILSIAAAFADGTTRMTNLAELRVKESDRLAMMATGLDACGVRVEAGEDSLTIHGNGHAPQGGADVETALDHRIAMSFLIMGLASTDPVSVDDASPITTSFPTFVKLLRDLGADLDAC